MSTEGQCKIVGNVLDCHFNKSLSHEHTFVNYPRVRFTVDKTLRFIAIFGLSLCSFAREQKMREKMKRGGQIVVPQSI